jgi:ribosome biogenesis protein MAK21
MLTLHQPPFICGALYLLGELFNSTPGLRRMLIEPEDDGEEHFVDADGAAKPDTEPKAPSGPVYDGKKREPQYAHADTSCLWELLPFTTHFHPSVALQANQLLMGEQLTGSPDISLNTLISFLDKFVYRNPKKTAAAKGASIMQPAAVSDHTGTVIRMRGARAGGDAVNSEAFWRKKVEDVPADQLFFHKFFAAKLARKEASKKKTRADDDEDMSENEFPESLGGSDEEDAEEGGEEDEESDADEAEIWKAMQDSMPDAGDDMGISDDSDDDVDYSEDEEAAEGEAAEESEDEDEDEEMGESGDDAGDRDDVSDEDDFPSFDDDDDDLIPLEEMPDEVLNAESDEEEEEDAAAGAKRKRREERKERRKKRKEMPAFASYEDYAKLIEQDSE